MLCPVVVPDRNGTFIEEVRYLNHVNRFRKFPLVAAAIHRFNR